MLQSFSHPVNEGDAKTCGVREYKGFDMVAMVTGFPVCDKVTHSYLRGANKSEGTNEMLISLE